MSFTRVLTAIAVAASVLTFLSPVQAGPFDKIKKKIEGKADETVDKATEKKPSEEAAPGTKGSESTASAPAGDQLKPGEGAWANYDFKPGDRVLFADDFTKDEIGDFPRRFELVSGTMEIVEWQAGRWLRLTSTSKFNVPLSEPLPERYTLEFDYAVPHGEMWIYPHGQEGGGLLIFGNGGVAGVAW